LLLAFAVSALAGCAATRAAGRTFANPVYRHDFPDPFVLKVGRTYYAYATGTGVLNLQVMTSSDLIHWKSPKEALPHIGAWAEPVNSWAPSVLRLSKRRFVMYYSAPDLVSTRECIGLAVSSSPAGPFRDTEKKPLICPSAQGGAIDPTVLRDGEGRLYIYWKNDGNCCGTVTHIYGQRLSASGLKLLTHPQPLAVNDQSWEGNVIEGPTMWQNGGTYYLFYSGNDTNADTYAVGYSACTSPLGPCIEFSGNPILKSRCKAAGPGGESIITDARGQTWMIYHAWLKNAIGRAPGRVLWLDRLAWSAQGPSVSGPTCNSQPGPAT
jgi:beta-xylosidase